MAQPNGCSYTNICCNNPPVELINCQTPDCTNKIHHICQTDYIYKEETTKRTRQDRKGNYGTDMDATAGM